MFDALENFRDFGGYALNDGRRLKTGLLLRSAQHSKLTDQDLERLAAMGISAVVDLRRTSERERQPSRRWAGFDGVIIENDLGNPDGEHWEQHLRGKELSWDNLRSFMIDFYRTAPFEERHLDLYRRYFDVLERTPGAVLVHCAGGKDRTGMIVALTHHLAGVPADRIMHDYLLTNTAAKLHSRGAHYAEWIEKRIGRRPTDADALGAFVIDEEHLDTAFAAMTAGYGSVDGYLEQALGVTPQRKAAILARLTEPAA